MEDQRHPKRRDARGVLLHDPWFGGSLDTEQVRGARRRQYRLAAETAWR
jgi:hypothetical protein